MTSAETATTQNTFMRMTPNPPSTLLLGSGRPSHAEAIQRAVERCDVRTAIGDRQTAEVVPRRNLLAARPQFLAGDRVECVQGGITTAGNAPNGPAAQAAAVSRAARLIPCGVLQRLRGVFASGIRERNTASHDDL